MTSQALKTIRLYGKLGAQFGRVHRLAVANTGEAIRALCTVMPGFRDELMLSKLKGIAYAVFIGKENIGQGDLLKPTGSEDIRIAPILQGAKQAGWLQMFIGAALVIGAGLISGGGAFAALGAGGMGGFVAGIGASMFLGGVLQVLSPQQVGNHSSANNGANYNFSGAVNTTSQGNSVPLLYGRMIVGSSVISAGIYSEDQ